MSGEDRGLARIATSLADGDAIDWQHAEESADPSERRLIRHLRLVASISHVHRTLSAGADEPAESAGEDPQGRRWGRLILRERIGEGTSCEVFRAWDTELHREVALKLLKPGAGGSTGAHDRVLAEARRLARVNHDNVVRVYGAEPHDGRVGLWMELVEGQSLDDTVRARGRFSAAEAAIVGQHLCAALAAVHGAGLLHRDVKAQNVMRDATGRIVLMDFGTGEPATENTGTNRLVGTPLYLAPEIFAGRPASAQSDLYSLGVTLFYLVSGKYPYAAISMEGLSDAHARRQIQHLRDLRPDLPPPFIAAIERALDPDPSRRYRSAGEMEAALRQSLDPRPAAASSGRHTRAWAFTAVAALLLLIVSGLIVWTRQTPVSTESPAQVESLAVLPMVDLSAASVAPHLADAMTDELIATLGRIQSLRVIPRTSVMRFKNTQQSVPEIASALKVDAVLESSMRVEQADAAGPALVRVNARLLSAGASGSTIWSASFDRPMGQLLALQDDIARSLTGEIQAVLTEGEQRRLTETRTTTPAADEAYFRGLHHLAQLSVSHARLALEAFRRAVELDSDHAAARAGLARAYITLGFLGAMSQPEARALALAQANVAATEDSSEAYAVLGDIRFYYDWDWSGAEDAYRRALSLNDDLVYARTQYARYLAAAGRLDEAVAEARRATVQDPLSPGAFSTLALIQHFRREHPAALETLDRAMTVDPSSAGAYFIRSRVHAARGAIREAIAANDRAIELSPEPATSWRAQRVQLAARMGPNSDTDRALKLLISETKARQEHLGRAHLAYIQIAMGRPAQALQLLREAADARDPDVLWLAVDPRVDAIRHDPDFHLLLQRVGVPPAGHPSR